MTASPPSAPPPPSLKRLLTLTIGIRLVVDTGVRMLYPFLPAIGRGLGISLVAASTLITIRTAVGLLAPWGGIAIERFGPKRVILTGMAVQAVGLAWFSITNGWFEALGPVLLLGIPIGSLVPAIQTFVSEQVPYSNRGRILGAVEFSWAATNLFMVPAVGVLIAAYGWAAPFRYLAGMTVIGMAGAWRWFPASAPPVSRPRMRLPDFLWRLRRHRSALGVIISGGCLFIGAESFFVTYAAWLEQTAGLNPAGIGAVAGVLGLTEWGGSGLSSAFIDRIGKRRGVLTGFVLAGGMLLVLPHLDRALWASVAGLGLYSLIFEFTVVSSIPLLSEQMPEARGLALAMGVWAISFTRLIAAPTAAWLLENGSFTATCTAGAIGTAAGVWFLARWVKEGTHPEGPGRF